MTRRPLCFVCLVLILIIYLMDLAGISVYKEISLPETLMAQVLAEESVRILGEVKEHTAREKTDYLFLTKASLIDRSQEFPIENVIVYTEKNAYAPVGALIVVSGKLSSIEGPRNPGEFDQKNYYACKGVSFTMFDGIVEKISEEKVLLLRKLYDFREWIKGRITQVSGKYAPFYHAMLLGDKSGLDEEMKTRLEQAGFLHILTISGLHIGVLGMNLYEALIRCGCGFFFSGFLSFFAMLFYALLVGSGAATLRAVVMFIMAVGAKILGRTYDVLTAVAVSAMLLLLDEPAWIYSCSFWLSFGAVLAVAYWIPWVIRLAEIERNLIKNIIMAVGIPLFMAPVQLYFFGEISLCGILLNLLLLPTVEMVLLSGCISVAATLVSRSFAQFLALPGNWLVETYIRASEWAGKLPYTVWIGGRPTKIQITFYFLLWWGMLSIMDRKNKDRDSEEGNFRSSEIRYFKPRHIKRALIFVVIFTVLGLQHIPSRKLELTFLDVGQGDSTVICIPDGGELLIDCGSTTSSGKGKYTLLPFLRQMGIGSLEGIVISHTDEDHISGVREMLEQIRDKLTVIQIGTLILPELEMPNKPYEELCALAKECEIPVQKVKEGISWNMGEAEFHILSPMKGASGEDINEDAIVMELCYKGFTALFTGDIGADTEERLADSGMLPDIEVLKTAHHGSRYSTSQLFLDKTSPRLAVISCSSRNRYGHPSPDTIARLQEAGCEIEYTMKNGAIRVITDGRKMEVGRFIETVGKSSKG